MKWRWVAADIGIVLVMASFPLAAWSRTVGLITVLVATLCLFAPMLPRKKG
jgi:hypothetical protein